MAVLPPITLCDEGEAVTMKSAELATAVPVMDEVSVPARSVVTVSVVG